MSHGTRAFEITLMGRPYRVSCAADEEKDLLAAVRYVDMKMTEIRQEGKVIGNERIAVMAALNIAHEMLQLRGSKHLDTADIKRRISLMRATIAEALADVQDKLL